MCQLLRQHCNDCNSIAFQALTECKAGQLEDYRCKAGAVRFKDQRILNCPPCYRKWRDRRILDLWQTENALERQQRQLFMSNQPYRVARHRDKARREQELYYSRSFIARALRYTRQQINALERQYMGNEGEGRLNRHNLGMGGRVVIRNFRYRIVEDDGHAWIDRCWRGDSVVNMAVPDNPY